MKNTNIRKLKIVLLSISFAVIVLFPSEKKQEIVEVIHSPKQEIKEDEEEPPSIEELISTYSKEHDVSPDLMMAIMKCENDTFDPTRQSGITYSFNDPKRGIVKGETEKSFGLVQIHLPDNPNITYEQATDAKFSINFLAQSLSDGYGKRWSCYSIVSGQDNSI